MAILSALRPGGKPVEVGRLAYPPAQLARTRAAWRARARRESLRAQRWATPLGIALGCVFGAYVASAAGDLAGAGTGMLMLAGCAAWPGLRFEAHATPVRAAEAWKAAWDDAARCLRTGLDHGWTLCWDRHLPGWASPVTVAVGPSGIWGIWIAPPGTRNDPDSLAQVLAAIFPEAHQGGVAVQVRTHTAARNTTWWRQVATEMVCANLSASPGDCRKWLERLDQTTLADPEAMRDG